MAGLHTLLTLFGFLVLMAHLVALALPAWTLERIPNDGTRPALGTGFLGLFEYHSFFDQEEMVNDYSFCKSYVPVTFALEKCLSWRIAQTTSLASVFLAYTGLLLLYLCSMEVIRPGSLSRMYSFSCSTCGLAGFSGVLSALAWQALEYFLKLEHEKKRTRVHVLPGYAFYMALAASLAYIVIPMVATLNEDSFRTGYVVRSLLPSSVLPKSSRVKRSRSTNGDPAGEGMVEMKEEYPAR